MPRLSGYDAVITPTPPRGSRNIHNTGTTTEDSALRASISVGTAAAGNIKGNNLTFARRKPAGGRALTSCHMH